LLELEIPGGQVENMSKDHKTKGADKPHDADSEKRTDSDSRANSENRANSEDGANSGKKADPEKRKALSSLKDHIRGTLDRAKVQPILEDILRSKEFDGASKSLRDRALLLVEAMRAQINEDHLEKIIGACYQNGEKEEFEKSVKKIESDYSPFGVREMLTRLLRKFGELDQAAIGDILGRGTDELEADLVKHKALADEYLCTLRVVKADFDNYRKRADRDKCDLRKSALSDFVSSLLPTLDALDAAINDCMCVGPKEGEGLVKVRKLMSDSLAKAGLERMEALGARFDPNFHEAASHEYAEGKEPDTVIDVLRAGWIFAGRVLRPALVRVAGSSSAGNPNTDSGDPSRHGASGAGIIREGLED
jgi:molecular chaperone GrpE